MPAKLPSEFSALWTRPKSSPAEVAALEKANLIERRAPRSGLYRLTGKGMAAKAELDSTQAVIAARVLKGGSK